MSVSESPSGLCTYNICTLVSAYKSFVRNQEARIGGGQIFVAAVSFLTEVPLILMHCARLISPRFRVSGLSTGKD